LKAQELKAGQAVVVDGQLYVIVSVEHVKPGKGPAYAQVKAKNAQTGSHIEKRFRSGEDVQDATLDRREMEYLYSDADGAVFMDSETFEQVTVPADVLGNAMDFVKPNTVITGFFHEGRIINVELPSTVDLTVSDTPPGIKGATATNQLKEATLETGLKTRVPPFITNGEVVRVSTETGEYVARVSSE